MSFRENVAAALLYDAVDGGKAEPGALAHLFGGEDVSIINFPPRGMRRAH